MKKILILACAALLTTATFASNGAVKVRFTDEGTDYIPCLGVDVTYTIIYSAVLNEVWDKSGGSDQIGTWKWMAIYDAVDVDMSWSSRGAGPWVEHANGNNEQAHITWKANEVLFADGDFPNLLYKWEILGAVNASRELTVIRINDSFTCLPN